MWNWIPLQIQYGSEGWADSWGTPDLCPHWKAKEARVWHQQEMLKSRQQRQDSHSHHWGVKHCKPHWFLSDFFIFKGHQKMPPTLGEGLLSLRNTSWKCPHRLTQRHIFLFDYTFNQNANQVSPSWLCVSIRYRLDKQQIWVWSFGSFLESWVPAWWGVSLESLFLLVSWKMVT